jgi:hypothetical protein
MSIPRLGGAAIVGHDRLDELLVVHVVVRSRALQLLDSRYCFASEHLSVSGNANLTRPLRVRDATIDHRTGARPRKCFPEVGKPIGKVIAGANSPLKPRQWLRARSTQ